MELKLTIKRICAAGLTLLLLLPLLVMSGTAAAPDTSYCYVYDSHGNANPSAAPYETRYRLDVSQLGIGTLKAASSLFVRGDELFICDTGNNRIVQLALEANGARLVQEITGTADGAYTFSNPTDIYVTDTGEMIIADSGNNRILRLDAQLKLLTEIQRPVDPTVDQTMPFKPNKLVVTANHIYLQAQSVNKGLMEFTLDGEFVGYIGASPVKFDWEDYIWKMISTDTQRQAMVAFVPTEYNNIALDSEGFLFVTNSVFSKQELNSGQAEPIRRLNLKGTNILIENGNNAVIGDLTWDKDGPSKFVDVTVQDDGTYYALDSIRSRIFAYDNQGNMLYAFGGIGTKTGYFTSPVSIEHHGNDLLVLDSANGLVTVMGHTGFGALVSQAISDYSAGRYDESMACWQEVLKHNGSYELAYRGIGKVLLRNGDYAQALDYLEYAKDEYYYSKAWKLYRKDWIENNIVYIVVVLLSAVAVMLIYKLVSYIKGKVDNYELWHSKAG